MAVKLRPGMLVKHKKSFAVVKDVSSTMAWIQYVNEIRLDSGEVISEIQHNVWPVSKFQLRKVG